MRSHSLFPVLILIFRNLACIRPPPLGLDRCVAVTLCGFKSASAAPAGTHVGDSDCVGGELVCLCSGVDLRLPGIPRRTRGPI